VRVGVDSGKTLSELTSLSIQLGSTTLTLDSNTIRLDISVLIQAKLLGTSDSTKMFPPYPVRVTSPIAVAGSLTAGGSAVAVTGSFSWTSGHSIKPLIRVGTSTPGDSANISMPTERFLPADTTWSLSGNLQLQANAAAAAGIDTLVITLSDSSGHSATSRALFQVVTAPPSTPRIVLLAPSNQLGNTLPQGTDSLFVSWGVSNWGDVNTDSVSINGSKANKLSDSTWGQNVYVFPNGQVSTITFRAVGKNASAATSFMQVTRAKDTVPPVIVPGTSAVTRSVPFDTTSVRLGWSVKDNFSLTFLSLNGAALTPSTTPGQTANLQVGPNVFVLVATDTFGNTSRDSFVITRGPDVTGPSIVWINPSTSIGVDATVASYKVQVKATDLSGVDSVYLQGLKANNDSGSYWSATVPLPSSNGVPVKIVAKAWDHVKNLSVDSTSITITRNVPTGTDKPALMLLQPSSNVGNALPFTSDTLHIVYKIKDLVPLDSTTILFGSVVPKRLTDSTWAADVPVPATAQPFTITIQVANTNKVGSVDQIVVTRAKDTVPPTIARGAGASTRSVVFDTASATFTWTVTDNYKMGSLTLNGVALPLTSTVTATKSLAVGVNTFVLVATDSFGNVSKDSIAITRSANTTAPVVTHATGTGSQTVPYATSSINLGWGVSAKVGLASITLNGNPVAVGSTVSKTASLTVGVNPFVLVVTDSSGNTTKDSIAITRSPNTTAPVVTHVTGTGSQAVPYATSSISLGWGISGTVGIASITLNGTAVPVSSTVTKTAALTVGVNPFVLVVTDSSGNTTKDSIAITRNPNTTAPVVTHVTGTSSQTVPYATSSISLGWGISGTVGIASITLNGTAVPLASTVTKTVSLTVGVNPFVLVVTDSTNNTTKDSIAITRSPNTTAPTITRAAADTVKSVLYATNSVTLGWTISANAGIASITLNGTSVPAASTVTKTTSLAVGSNTFVLVVTDSTNLSTRDSFVITRGGDITPPTIVRNSGTSNQTLANTTTSYAVSWTVTDNVKMGSVTIGGTTIAPATGGVYSTSINLTVGTHKIGIVALDSAGNKSTDTVVLARSALAPTHSAVAGTYIGTVYDTLKSPGADSIEYSTDGTIWLPNLGAAAIQGTGQITIYARAFPGGAISNVALKISQIKAMAAGATHSIFVKNDGSVWTTGYNPFGELGNGMTTTISTPDSIMNGVVAVAAGGENSLYQKADGSVWASGVNNFGELGTGNTNSVLVPTSVFSGASAISTSGIRSLFLKSGTAWIIGSNGVATEALSPDSVLAGVIAVAGSGDFLTSDHVAWFMDVGDVQPSQILYGVSSFSSNSSGCSLFLKTDGTIWAMGQNSYGQCGDGTTNTIAVPKQVSSMAGVVSVIAGGNHSLILTSDHSLYAVGQIDTSYSRNGTFGESLPTLTLVMTNVASAVAGDMYSLVLKQDGSLWAFGLNSSGQFGNGTMTSTVVPVRVNF